MSYSGQISGSERAVAAGGALLGLILVSLVLANGLDLTLVHKADEAISAIALPAPQPPEPVSIPVEQPADAKTGAASAANRHARAAAVLASKPVLPAPDPPPTAAATKPGSGSDASAGAAPIVGPGSGAGGRGDGSGAGGSGHGTGGGTRPVWQSGRIDDRDYPKEARRAKIGGEVEVRFSIEANGRVTRCRVSRSSGDASLDATTCRLIEERFRFRPATNAAGDPVASSYGWRQRWWLEGRGGPG